jgi:hypothetical protein
MKIFTAVRIVFYEGSFIIGTFSSLTEACDAFKEYIKESNEAFVKDIDDFVIYAYELGEVCIDDYGIKHSFNVDFEGNLEL